MKEEAQNKKNRITTWLSEHWKPDRGKLVSVLLDLLVIAVLLVTAVLAAYRVNGIWPFGEQSIARGDMVQQTIPGGMYYAWDVLHGRVSPFFSFYSAYGLNLSGANSLGALLSPTNFFLLFVARNRIADFANILVILKMLATAYVMYAYLRQYELKRLAYVAGALVYAFGAASLVHFQIILVMEAAFFLPLLMIGVERIIKKRGSLFFTLILAYAMMTNVYTGCISLIYVFLAAALRVCLGSYEKKERFRSALELGLSVVVAFLLSAVVTIPAVLCISDAPRLSGGGRLTDTYRTAIAARWSVYDWKSVQRMAVNIALPIACIGFCLARAQGRTREFFKTYGVHLLLSLFMVLSVLVAGTELLWHGGSRASWPVRFIYVISFTLVDFAAYAYQRYLAERMQLGSRAAAVIKEDKRRSPAATEAEGSIEGEMKPSPLKDSKKKVQSDSKHHEEKAGGGVSDANDGGRHERISGSGWLRVGELVTVAAAWIAIFGAAPLFHRIYEVYCQNENYGTWQDGIFILVLGVVMLALYHFCFSGRLEPVLLVLLCVELTVSGVISFAPNKENAQVWDPTYLKYAANVSKHMKTKISPQEKVKNVDYTIDHIEYGNVLGVSTMSNYWHVIPSDLQSKFQQLGYTINWTQCLDTGGTIFSDTLLGTKYFLNCDAMSEALYSPKEQIAYADGKDITLYENNFTLPYAVAMDAGQLDYQGELFATQNALFQAVTGSEQSLLSDISSEVKGDTLTWQAKGKQVLYFYGTNTTETPVTILIDGQPLPIAASSSADNIQYPTDFDNGLICLGVFENQKVQIQFSGAQDASVLHVAVMDYQTVSDAIDRINQDNPKLTGFHQGRTSLRFQMKDMKKSHIFLPLINQKGWSVKINGKAVKEIDTVAGMMSVPVPHGNLKVVLHYTAPGRRTGALITILTLAVLIGVGWLQRKRKKAGKTDLTETTPVRVLGIAAFGVLVLLLVAVVVLLFVVPAWTYLMGILGGTMGSE